MAGRGTGVAEGTRGEDGGGCGLRGAEQEG